MSLFKTLTGVFKPKSGGSRLSKPKKIKFKAKKPKKKKTINKPQRIDYQDITAIREAQAQAKEIVIEAKGTALKIRQVAENESQKIKMQLNNSLQQVAQDKNHLDRDKSILNEKNKSLILLQTSVSASEVEVEDLKKRLLEELEKTASMTKDEAKDKILAVYEKRLTAEIAKKIKQAEEKSKEESDEKAREILVDSMRHGATDYVAEFTISTVKLPEEGAKGKIIGKDGRNIRAFERATGVDVDLDDSPGQVRLSCFDGVRREIARQALIRLIRDGRIQPSRIDEYVKKAKSEIEKVMFEEGKKLCHAVGVYNLPRDLIAMLGRFKYRSSYGQNMIDHTLEETKIGIALAHEVGANADTVRLGCLLHDIGKIVEDEGSHVELGVKLLQKYRLPQEVIDCVEQHHEDVSFTSKESILVYISDAISGARPGARYENYEEYVKRLTKLEDIANSYKGVKEAFAIQAGREIRVVVNPKSLNDDQIVKLASDMKDQIQEEMTYPGTVTVNVVRETRATQVAK